MSVQLRLDRQVNPVADEVSALIAVVRPILEGTLYALKRDIVSELGGYDRVKLNMLARVYRPGDGDCGLCFEYAIHDAMNRLDGMVLDRVLDAVSNFCRVPGSTPSSILFGAEKSGAIQLIETTKDRLTNDSLLLVGNKGRPVKLRRHIDMVVAAFRRPNARKSLPQSISGLWKADLFVGFSDSDRWIGTTVKINPHQLEPAKGLRVGIVPAQQGSQDRIYKDDQRNLIVCPLCYDGAFMEVFYEAWGIVQQFIAADAQLPREVALPRPAHRHVARILADRRDYSVLEVVEALRPLAQPELLSTDARNKAIVVTNEAEIKAQAVIAPIPRYLKPLC